MSGRLSDETARLIRAFGYSLEGLSSALRQPAFRLELLLGVPAILLSLFFDVTPAEHALLAVVIFLVWITELLNSAVEAAIDRIGSEIHPLSKQAKDIGSAAVLMSLLCAGTVWLMILAG